MREDTRIQSFSEPRDQAGEPVSPPICRTSLFTFPDCESFEKTYSKELDHPLYSRVSNPTTTVLNQKLADLEHAQEALSFSSGMAAISTTLLALLKHGDRLVLQDTAYSPTLALARDHLTRFGIEVIDRSIDQLHDLEQHLPEETKLVYLESPASITFELLDLERIVLQAKKKDIPIIFDNSWASPLFSQPLDWGVDIVLHSVTKYINGHSDVVAGTVAGSGEHFEKIKSFAPLHGGFLAPDESSLVLRGLRTLPLRMRQHEQAGLKIASFLEVFNGVEKVFHPALESSSQHSLFKKYFTGSSGLFSFRYKGDVRKCVDALKLFHIGVSWGGFESLVLPTDLLLSNSNDKRLRPDVPEGLIRLSIGLEDVDDLIEDLERGLKAGLS